MKKLPFVLLTICFVLIACNNDEITSQEQDSKKLDKMYQEIVELSGINSQMCTDSKDWDFTSIGSKSCGGVAGYIIYSKKIDTVKFLEKVKAFTDAQIVYQKKWNIFSTCDLISPPTGVKCVDGKPQFSSDPIL